MSKDPIKDIILKTFSKSKYSIIINSYGRSGSTVLTKGILKSIIKEIPLKNSGFVKSSFDRDAWDLNKIILKNGAVYKTHDYPPSVLPKGKFKMLYTFANPINVVKSVQRLKSERGMDWIHSHLEHLKVEDSDIKKIEEKDTLNLEKHLNAWLKETRFPIMFLNYENMWDHSDEISKFLGFDLRLPEFKKRKSNFKKEGQKYLRLEKVYGSLIHQISNLEDCFVTNQ